MKKDPTPTRPISPEETAALKLLFDKVTFLPGSYDKRFVHSMFAAKFITQKQSELILEKLWRYRRQIGGDKAAQKQIEALRPIIFRENYSAFSPVYDKVK